MTEDKTETITKNNFLLIRRSNGNNKKTFVYKKFLWLFEKASLDGSCIGLEKERGHVSSLCIIDIKHTFINKIENKNI